MKGKLKLNKLSSSFLVFTMVSSTMAIHHSLVLASQLPDIEIVDSSTSEEILSEVDYCQ